MGVINQSKNLQMCWEEEDSNRRKQSGRKSVVFPRGGAIKNGQTVWAPSSCWALGAQESNCALVSTTQEGFLSMIFMKVGKFM